MGDRAPYHAPCVSRERAQPLFGRQACLSVAGVRGASTAMDAAYSLTPGVSLPTFDGPLGPTRAASFLPLSDDEPTSGVQDRQRAEHEKERSFVHVWRNMVMGHRPSTRSNDATDGCSSLTTRHHSCLLSAPCIATTRRLIFANSTARSVLLMPLTTPRWHG